MFFERNIRVLFIALIILLVQLSTFEVVSARTRNVNLPDNWHKPEGWAEVNLIGFWSDKIPTLLQGTVNDVVTKDKNFGIYGAPGFKLGPHLFEPTIGYSFGDKELIGAFRIRSDWKHFKGYSNFEYQPKSQSLYYIAQFEAKNLIKFSITKTNLVFNIGLEIEGRGHLLNIKERNGVGAYFVLNFVPHHRHNNDYTDFRFEGVIQNKEIDGNRQIQLIARFKFYSKTL